MNKSKFGIIFDSLAISFIFFLLTFSWFYRLFKIRLLSIILSCVIFLVSFILNYKISLKKYKLSKVSIKDSKLFKNSMLKLKFLSEKESIKSFENLLSSKNITKNIFKNKNSLFYINLNVKMTAIDFVTANNFYLETDKSLPLCFIFESFSEEFSQLVNESPIKYSIFSSNELFEIMKIKIIYPENIENIEFSKKYYFKQKKLKFIESLSKARFKDFFFTGLSLVAISIIIPYSLYYLISGTIMLFLSFLCLVLKQNKNKKVLSEKNLKDYC